MAVCILLLAGLCGAYFWINHSNTQKELAAAESEPQASESESLALIQKEETDLESITYQANGNEIVLLPITEKSTSEALTDRITWVIEDYDDVSLNSNKMSDMARIMFSMTAAKVLMDKGENLSEYGLQPPLTTVVGKYKDGSSTILNIGVKTPAKDYYYATIEGDPAIYLLYTSVGDRANYGFNDVIDKTLPEINSDFLQYAYIHSTGNPEIEFDFKGSEAEKNADLETYGVIALTMMKPYEGREMYLSNFQTSFMEPLGTLSLGDLVDASPSDLAPYGLDDPEGILRLKDNENELHLLFGDKADDDNVYVKYADRPSVFLMRQSALQTIQKVDVFKFINRFVALTFIDNCDKIEITGQGTTYVALLNHETIPPETEEDEEDTIIKPTINGQEVQEKAFKTYYQSLIGISYDTEIETYVPDTDPVVTITYTMNNGEPPAVARYYEYNKDFYAVQEYDYDIHFVVSKQTVDLMYRSMADLMEGKLNR